jgi:hypothetical protein
VSDKQIDIYVPRYFNMSTDHPHVNRANDAPPDEDIKPPNTFGNFPLDEAVIESGRIRSCFASAYFVDIY